MFSLQNYFLTGNHTSSGFDGSELCSLKAAFVGCSVATWCGYIRCQVNMWRLYANAPLWRRSSVPKNYWPCS